MAARRLRQTANAVPAEYGARSGFPVQRGKFPDRAISFPVRAKKFPVRMHRELANKSLIYLVFFRVDLPAEAPNRRNTLYFPS